MLPAMARKSLYLSLVKREFGSSSKNFLTILATKSGSSILKSICSGHQTHKHTDTDTDKKLVLMISFVFKGNKAIDEYVP
jgi:hypothetical protein